MKSDSRGVDEEMKLQEIKERITFINEAEKFVTTGGESARSKIAKQNILDAQGHYIDDVEWLVNRIDQYGRVNIKLTQDYVDSEDRIKYLEETLSNIAFGYVEGDYADVRQYAREALTPKEPTPE